MLQSRRSLRTEQCSPWARRSCSTSTPRYVVGMAWQAVSCSPSMASATAAPSGEADPACPPSANADDTPPRPSPPPPPASEASPSPSPALARRWSDRRARRKSSIAYVSTPTSSHVSTPASDSAGSPSPSASPSPRALHRHHLSVSSTTSSLTPIAESIALASPSPRPSPGAVTAMDKNAHLLFSIAAHEQKCLELRDQLARTEAEADRLRAQWQAAMASTLAQQEPNDSPSHPSSGPKSSPRHARYLSRSLTSSLFDVDSSDATSATAGGGSDLTSVQAAATHAFKDWSGRLHTLLEDALTTPPTTTPEGSQHLSNGNEPSTERLPPITSRVPSRSSQDRSRDPTPTLKAREFSPNADTDSTSTPSDNLKYQNDGLPPNSLSSETLHSSSKATPSSVVSVPSSQSSKRNSILTGFGQNSTWGDWSARLQEAKTGASALLAKAERGLEGLIVMDDQPASSHQSASRKDASTDASANTETKRPPKQRSASAMISASAPALGMLVDIADPTQTVSPSSAAPPVQDVWQLAAERERTLLRQKWGSDSSSSKAKDTSQTKRPAVDQPQSPPTKTSQEQNGSPTLDSWNW